MTKEEIFDWVITFENEVLSRAREEVIKTAEFNYGDVGRQVAEYYYRQIDGEAEEGDLGELSVNEDCDDCKERAKRLLDSMDMVKKITEILISDTLNFAIEKSNVSNMIELSKDMAESITNKSCYNLDRNDIQLGLILKACKEVFHGSSQNG